MIPYSLMKRLITMAVIGAEKNDDNKAFIYMKNVNGILDSDDSTVKTLDADYEDIDSIHNLDITNTVWKTC